MFKMPAERVYWEKIRTVEELQQRITEEWKRLDQRVIDNAVVQWCTRLRTCVAGFSPLTLHTLHYIAV